MIGIVKISNSLSVPALQDNANDIYKSNIQIAEINSLAASIAVIEWKKRISYYHNMLQDIGKPKNEITYDIT